MFPSNLIRKKFLDYFKKNNHKVIHSSSLVPQNDPSLLFTNLTESPALMFTVLGSKASMPESLPSFTTVVAA